MNPSQLGRNETYLNTGRPSRFSSVALTRPRNLLDRTIDGRVRTNQDCFCGDKFVVANCFENATSDKRNGQEALVVEGNNSLLTSKFETTREFESERIGLSVEIICNLFSEIIVSSGAVH
jgi:hypothetical protein